MTIICTAFCGYSNPWVPSQGRWKYSFSFLKNSISKYSKQEIKLYNDIHKSIAILNNRIYLIRQNLHFTPQQRINREKEVLDNIANLHNMQDKLLTSYMVSERNNQIEYGVNKKLSIGLNIGDIRRDDLYHSSTSSRSIEMFAKTNLYNHKGYVFSLQPKLGFEGRSKTVSLNTMLGHSHKTRKKFLGRSMEIFEYIGFEVKKLSGLKKLHHPVYNSEIAAGIKWNDRTILMIQDTEYLNHNASKIYNKIHKTHITLAHDINFSKSNDRNKFYLNCGYFVVSSVKARRQLASGYSFGLWVEL